MYKKLQVFLLFFSLSRITVATQESLEKVRDHILAVKKSLTSTGTIKIKELSVDSDTAEVHNVTAKELTSNAVAVFNNLAISRYTELEQSTIIKNSTLMGTLLLSGEFLFLNNDTVENIICSNDNKQEQVIELHDSTITGDIEFKHGNGLVILKGNSKIVGKVIGGKVVKN